MRAAVLPAFGPPEHLKIEDQPDPLPGAGQVVVDVELASVTSVTLSPIRTCSSRSPTASSWRTRSRCSPTAAPR